MLAHAVQFIRCISETEARVCTECKEPPTAVHLRVLALYVSCQKEDETRGGAYHALDAVNTSSFSSRYRGACQRSACKAAASQRVKRTTSHGYACEWEGVKKSSSRTLSRTHSTRIASLITLCLHAETSRRISRLRALPFRSRTRASDATQST